jgi:predicted Zn-dependent protease
MVGNLAQMGAAMYVQGFSRDQELEADRLGVRYLTRAGYDPRAMASFLSVLQAESALAAKIAGREGYEPTASLFSSHPRTVDRVVQAADAAQAAAGGGQRIGRDEYLLRLDGTLYGDDPSQGLRRGRLFAHPKLRFRFEVPPGFSLRNTPKAVLATHKNGAVIQFDSDKIERETTMTRYLTTDWLGNVPIENVEAIDVNGMKAATGTASMRSEKGSFDVRALAIRFDDSQAYRFLILTPTQLTAGLGEDMRRMTFSFRRLSGSEAAALKPLRVRTHKVNPGETAVSLAATMPFDELRTERFQALNGLKPGEELRPGQLVKIIRE